MDECMISLMVDIWVADILLNSFWIYIHWGDGPRVFSVVPSPDLSVRLTLASQKVWEWSSVHFLSHFRFGYRSSGRILLSTWPKTFFFSRRKTFITILIFSFVMSPFRLLVFSWFNFGDEVSATWLLKDGLNKDETSRHAMCVCVCVRAHTHTHAHAHTQKNMDTWKIQLVYGGHFNCMIVCTLHVCINLVRRRNQIPWGWRQLVVFVEEKILEDCFLVTLQINIVNIYKFAW